MSFYPTVIAISVLLANPIDIFRKLDDCRMMSGSFFQFNNNVLIRHTAIPDILNPITKNIDSIHGINKYDTCPLPVPDRLTGATEYTKQCFWLNNKYIANVISVNNTKK